MPVKSVFATVRLAKPMEKWAATLIANVISTYALDTICTAAGILLVASGLLSGLDFRGAAIVLALSYFLWAGGLSTSLTANWRLLERTGTSTSLLSKLAYDLAGLWTKRAGLRRFLSAAGYVVFELAKESPYYLGAFGLAFASEAISGEEALVFLAGANAGAAVYEYVLGRSTRLFIGKTETTQYASFEKEWSPAQYLTDYYSAVDADERNTIAFFTEAARRMPAGEPALVFGVGPTLHHVFALAGRASEIHLGDYLRCNLDAITRWIDGEEGAHDWRPFIRYTLNCEGVENPGPADVRDRELLTRARITALLEVDMRNDRPLANAQRDYATVLTAYCVDSATDSLDDWQRCMRRVVDLVRPGGTLLVAALGRTRSYFVGGKAFPSPGLEAADLERALRDHFPGAGLTIRTVSVPACAPHGFSCIILAAAHGRRLPVPAAPSGVRG